MKKKATNIQFHAHFFQIGGQLGTHTCLFFSDSFKYLFKWTHSVNARAGVYKWQTY